MLVVYASRQGKTEALVNALGYESTLKIVDGSEQVSEPFETYGYAGVKISQEYHVPILAIINGSGSSADETKIKEMISALETKLNQL